MDTEEQLKRLEALLFIHGEPLSFKKIEDLLGLAGGEGERMVSELEHHLQRSARAVRIITGSGKAQLVTRPEYAELIEAFAKDQLNEDLTPAALEALAIIAYGGPLSKSKIEYLRGVNSAITLRNLTLRGLIERIPDPERPGSFLYQPTFGLLKHVGVEQIGDLPDYEKFQSLFAAAHQHTPETAQ